MLPTTIKSKDLIGKKVRTTTDIMNGAGILIPKGSTVNILRVSRGFTIQTEPCICCGLSAIVRGVTREEVELLENQFYTKNT